MELSPDVAVVMFTDQVLPTEISFTSDFLAFPSSASFEARTMTASTVEGATLFRCIIQGDEGKWEIYLPAPASESVNFSLPIPPPEFTDLGMGAVISLDPVTLIPGMTYEDLVKFDGNDLDQINRLTTAYSHYQLPYSP
jgi:hypothetical protein